MRPRPRFPWAILLCIIVLWIVLSAGARTRHPPVNAARIPEDKSAASSLRERAQRALELSQQECGGNAEGCWMGIYPGVMTFPEAESILRAHQGVTNVRYRTNYDMLHCEPGGHPCHFLELLCWETEEILQLPGCAATWGDPISSVPIRYVEVRVISSTLPLQTLVNHLGQPAFADIYVMRACVTTPRGFREEVVVADVMFDHTVAAGVVGYGKEPYMGIWSVQPDMPVLMIRYYPLETHISGPIPWHGFPVTVINPEKHCPRTSLFWPFGSMVP